MSRLPENPVEPATRITRAAQYVRMSTDHQKYSIENQKLAIRQYAVSNDFNIVRTYSDEGRSGLRIQGRPGLQKLLADVQRSKAGFDAVLVYDVSRWGRFQDVDESAHYEFLCRVSGVDVIYCAEDFPNNRTPASTIVKGVKRAMAGEYSRELSVKVSAGKRRLAELGYHQAGFAGFGLRRMLIDDRGHRKGVLEKGERKGIQSDRVILVPGPPEEVAIVNEIYRMVVDRDMSMCAIARELNKRGLKTDLGRKWTHFSVRTVLTHEKYTGTLIYSRRCKKLGQVDFENEPDKWVRKEGAFEAIVDPTLFEAVQRVLKKRRRSLYTDEQLVQHVRDLRSKYGYVTVPMLRSNKNDPTPAVYQHRFGGALNAYILAGFHPYRDGSHHYANRRLCQLQYALSRKLRSDIVAVGGTVDDDLGNGRILINKLFSVVLLVGRCKVDGAGQRYWHIEYQKSDKPDVIVFARVNAAGNQILDYFLIPFSQLDTKSIRVRSKNARWLDAFRLDALDFLIRMSRMWRIPEALT